MHIYTLRLRNYRNYEALELTFDPNINVFLGPNAQGKTNIIEAVYYASLGHSHRTHTDADLIRWEQPEALVQLGFSRLGVENKLEFQFSRVKRRRILLNDHPIRPKDLVGSLNTVLFSPEDLFLIKGAPALRRRFLDGEISQASPAYYHELTKYNKIVTQRNNLLKKIREHKAGTDMLDLWDVQLAASAVKITRKRQEAVRKLNMLANLMQRRISGNLENLAITYEIHGAEGASVTNDLESWYNKELASHRDVDIIRGSTGRGPHLDDIILMVNGINLRSFGSQGQQRTGVLSLKLAELEFLRSETGEYPVLLLDDVMSELDASRRGQLMDFIFRERIQTMITATDGAYFPQERIGTYYQVAAGQITR
ncbi:putative DNA replication and repair protein RecF [Selenomonas ruminantium subsp. lactilytica TAM6421]|uniref:DNA replication and repair protein RecF n=1 Tax=Selenomonas ruminantium subsp. lactilytica (strain NBRC 103574 / TAM6421) TaxID=927704 RepID=I0GLS5_SELRL|nr:DNA replication/repair protein RecF [Selenomonas ruminantium]BAL81712.1 putative DNA replication and repair protein RecF [Selenomonas ruminantium subsp. lactilytica TAM6421]